MKKQIITISREYGSGGRQIGLLTAERLGIQGNRIPGGYDRRS